MLTEIQIEAYGTKKAKAQAIENGNNPLLTFPGNVPALDAESTLESVAVDFATCYGWKVEGSVEDSVDRFFVKAVKHLCDKLRAGFHAGGLSPEEKALAKQVSTMSRTDDDFAAKLQTLMEEHKK